MPRLRSGWLIVALIAVGCASAPSGPRHDEPDLPAREGARTTLRTDLDLQDAAVVHSRLERLETLLDERAPWLERRLERSVEKPAPTRAVVVADELRWVAIARAHGVSEGGATAFACGDGEIVVRFRPEEWGLGPTGGWLLAPRSASVAEAVFRRRLEATYGSSLERTWLEDGCARWFSELAGRDAGEAQEAARRTRDDLVSAYVPLWLGSEPVLEKTAAARGSAAVEHARNAKTNPGGDRALAYAVARYLLENGRAKTIVAAFESAAGRPGADDAWTSARERLALDEGKFEHWLRTRTLDALLDALSSEPVAAARWEARSALKLLADVELPDDDVLGPNERERAVARARQEVARRSSVRFVDELEPRLIPLARDHRAGGLEQVVKDARAELDRRAQGYGHPAVESARQRLGQLIQERLRELSRRAPG